MTLLRYRFNPPIDIGRKKPTPSGRVYKIGWNDPTTIDVDEADVEFLLAFRGYCCTGGKQPMFERVEGAPDA